MHIIIKNRLNILKEIYKKPGIVTCKLNKQIDTTLCNLHKIIKRFEKMDLVERKIKDGKSYSLFITKKGQEVFKNLEFINKLWK